MTNQQNKLSEANNTIKNQQIIEKKYKELIEINNKKISELKNSFSKNKNELKDTEKKLSEANIEIEYLKKNDKISKKLINPLAYALIIFNSKPKEIKTNIKLYKTLKNNKCFNIGYYLKKYPDIPKSKWCKYFSPELHYVCKGFDENRKFNNRIYNTKTKKELIEYYNAK